MKMLKKRIRWIIVNGSLFAMVWLATIGPLKLNNGVVSLAKFILCGFATMVWGFFFLLLIAWIASIFMERKKNFLDLPKDTPILAFPYWTSVVFDLLVCFLCAYSGWTITSIIYLSHIIPQWFTLIILEETRKETKP